MLPSFSPSPPAPLPPWGEGSKRVRFPFSRAAKAKHPLSSPMEQKAKHPLASPFLRGTGGGSKRGERGGWEKGLGDEGVMACALTSEPRATRQN